MKIRRRLTQINAVIILMLALMISTSSAATKIWVGTDVNHAGAFDVAANWSPSGVPATGDNVYLEDSSQALDVNLAQSSITLATLNIAQSYTGATGTTTAYLDIEANTVEIGYSYGPATTLTGSGRIKLDLGTNPSAVTIHNSAVIATESSMPPIRILCDDSSATIKVRKGKVGIAYETGETSTIGTLTVNYITSEGSDADAFIGTGVTMTTLNQTGGDATMGCGATTATCEGGTLSTYGSGAITTLNASGGTVTSNSTGTITTLNITGGTVDFTKSASTRTVTTVKLDSGGVLKFDPDVLTITNKIISNNPVAYTASTP